MTNEECFVCGHRGARTERGLACPACGVQLISAADGVLVDVTADMSVSYPQTGADSMLAVEDRSFWFAHRSEVLAALLDRFAPDADVWDLGGGNGHQAMLLQSRGRKVVLVEPGARGCRNAARRGVQIVVCSALEALRLPDASVPNAMLLDVIEHIADPQPLLRECRRVVRDRLFVTVPAYDTLWSDEDEYAEHHRRYTMTRLRDQLEQASFVVEWASYFFSSLVAPIFVFRALPYRMKRRKGSAEPDLSEHTPRGLSQRIVAALLARERDQLRRGRTRAFGSSIVAVGRRS